MQHTLFLLSVIYKPFSNYRRKHAEVLLGEEYWRPLSDVILEDIDHPESKFENGDQNGLMKRRYIVNPELEFIGKEIKDLSTELIDLAKPVKYTNKKELTQKLLNMTKKEAKEKRVSRQALWALKKRLRKTAKKFNCGTKVIKQILVNL